MDLRAVSQDCFLFQEFNLNNKYASDYYYYCLLTVAVQNNTLTPFIIALSNYKMFKINIFILGPSCLLYTKRVE